MKVYVAGALADLPRVRAAQCAVVEAGHTLTHDWTTAPDATFTDGYGSRPDVSAAIVTEDLGAVLTADAVLVIASEHVGRGMFVGLGAALGIASRGELEHVVVIGRIEHESVFYFHPDVQHCAIVEQWLFSLARPAGS